MSRKNKRFEKVIRRDSISQFGRSMMEMLGVLAIVGILSVAGIKGYSQAMLKYKLNKQANQYTEIINNILTVLDNPRKLGSYNLTSTLLKLNTIPEEMIGRNKNQFTDAMGNSCSINVESSYFFNITINKRLGNRRVVDYNSCINLLTLSKELRHILWQTQFFLDDTSLDLRHLYGDRYCNQYVHCLKDLTLSQIIEICSHCQTQNNCTMRILWGNTR